MDHTALLRGLGYLQQLWIRKSARSALTSISSNNLNLNLAQDVLFGRAVVCATVDKHMLKITKQTENTGLTRVSLHGHFTGEYIAEVEKALSENSHKVVLDLMHVTLVDRAAMEFLATAKSSKIKIENVPSYVTRWIEQEVS